MKGRLFVLAGPDIGRSFQVRHGDTLGRSPGCVVALRHPSVSRKHAHLEVANGAFWVVDDGSRNGIQVEGERVRRLELHDHMEFALGELSLRFRLAEPTAGVERQGLAATRVMPAAVVPPAAAAAPEEPGEDPPADEGFALEAPEEIEIAPTVVAPEPRKRTAEPTTTTGKPVLQYHKVANDRGFAVGDLAQHPLWVRALVAILAVAVAVALFFAAFRGMSFLRS